MLAAAGFKDVVLEGGCGCRVENAAFAEKLEGVFVENLRPEVAVVTGTVATVENVVEVGCAVARDDFVDKTHLCACLGFELLNVDEAAGCIFRTYRL